MTELVSHSHGDNGIFVGKKKKEKTSTNRKTKGKDKSQVKRPESKNDIDLEEQSGGEADHGEIYIVSSRDEHCFKGMKKWITQFHQIRPGMNVLQQQIDDFITAHEEKLKQERKEREARAADGGWTVVVHNEGRKKTTDSESGIVVGSVAQAAVENKMAKKKCREVGLDVYRSQKKEAQRNEMMMLQSKFDEDNKRLQQLRAAFPTLDIEFLLSMQASYMDTSTSNKTKHILW
ncbi:hypothetical protein L6164_006811 [Bauhinia variegata]|uniref:Uncharacterized protein n=1 Tax=Bauhinia variegata TaxID=167791 RepID=A0ACB9PVT2_BAUVA|nr:hypothetical protein L6164_006811 [Bauhinia variegata]